MNILVILKEFLPAFLTGEEENAHLCDSDKQILSEALHLRDEISGQVTILTHGLPDSEDILSEIWSYAPDQVFMLPKDQISRDAACESYVNLIPTAQALASAIRQIGNFDLILLGRQAVDGDSIHIASLISHYLNLPLLPYTRDISLISDQKLEAVCIDDNFSYTVNVSLPAVVVSHNDNVPPRYPRMSDIRKAYGGRCSTRYLAKQPEIPGTFSLLQEYLPEPKSDTDTIFLSGANDQEKAEQLLELLRSMGCCQQSTGGALEKESILL